MDTDQGGVIRVRGRGRGRGGDWSPSESKPGVASPTANLGVARERARSRGIRQDSLAPNGGALLRDARLGQVQPGQDALVSMTSYLDSTHIITETQMQPVGRGGVTTLSKEQRGNILRTKPDTVDNKKGASGRQVDIMSNYFKLCGKPNWVLMQYRVDFKPEEDSTMMRKSFVRDLKPQLGKFMFDGTVLFTTSRLTPNKKTTLVLTTTRNSDNTPVEVTFKEVGEVQPTEHHYIQFFNIVLRQCLEKLNLQMLGRNYYDPKAARILRDFKLELWPGYVTSIRQHENDVLLCCEISTKVLRMDTVLDQLKECCKRDKKNWQALAQKMLLGAIVITRYNNKTYRIDEICFDKKPSDKFQLKNGTELDYRQYYLDRYNMKIEDSEQPMLVSMPKLREVRGGLTGPIYLVPELCNMTGLTDEQRANFQLMKAMAEYTRQTPDKRVESLKKFSARINDNEEIKQLTNEWNLQFSQALEKFRARVLEPETIYGAKGSKFTYPENNADWGNAFKRWQVVSTVTLTKWSVVYSKRDEESTQNFVKLLLQIAPANGIMLGSPKFFQILDNRPSTYIQQLSKVIDEEPDMVMIVVPNNKGEHYHAVKKLCCIEKPIPSQVMTGTVINKPKGLFSVASKVAMQMSCKLGGEPWNIQFPIKDTMIMGYDTYHDSSKKGTSVGAVVSSLNKEFTKYSSTCIFHENQEEITQGMGPAVNKALRRYREANGNLPSRIIMFRDGVGEGQIEYVRHQEIEAVKKALNDNIKLTYIIVSKRINTRFFMGGMHRRTKLDNPPSGTVVDDVVTLPERYDFFLISQSVRQGTVNPTSYNVIEDNSGLKPDHIQKLAYKLSHLYYNWPGTVRVPAPCQYAHKLAFLAGQSLHKEPSEKLEEQLFYL